MEAIEAHKLATIVGKASFVKTDCIYSENYLDIQKPYNEGINYDYPDGTPKYKYESVKETNFEVLPMNCRDDTFEVLNTHSNVKFNTIRNEDDYTGLTGGQKDALLKTLACKMLELG